MLKFFVCIAFTIICLSFPKDTYAFVDEVKLIPSIPTAGNSFDISFRVGVCHCFDCRTPHSPPLKIDVKGSEVNVIASGSIASGTWCNFPIATGTVDMPPLNPGNYSLNIKIMHDSPFILGEKITTVASKRFSVQPSGRHEAPSEINALDEKYLVALSFIVFIFGCMMMYRQGQR